MDEPELRDAGRDDAAMIAAWLNRPEINRYLSQNLRHGGMTALLVGVGLGRPDQHWMLFGPPSGPPCGLIALDSIEREDGHANVWFVLGDPGLAGRGLTSRALLRFCRENPAGLHVLTAWAVDANRASLRCMAKAGFETVGRVPGAASIGGARHDRVILARTLETACRP